MSKVTLLCRGESLGSINWLPRTKHSVVVNAFHFELEDENVHNYVSKCSSVTHVVSAGAVQHTSQMRHNNETMKQGTDCHTCHCGGAVYYTCMNNGFCVS